MATKLCIWETLNLLACAKKEREQIEEEKSRIRETLNLSTAADHRTDNCLTPRPPLGVLGGCKKKKKKKVTCDM